LKLEERFGAGAVSSLRSSTLGSQPAQEYVFTWPEGERMAVLASTDEWTYRLIYNSASPPNSRVLETVAWRGTTKNLEPGT